MDKSLFRQEVVPFFGQFFLLIIAALLSDQILHFFDLVWLGRLLGIPGTLLILLSLLYSLRKRKIITFGNPKTLLNLHETLTWMGALLVLVHAGIHFNTILPWLAMIGLIVNVLSGLVGQRLLHRSRQHMLEVEEKYRLSGMSKEDIDKEVFWDSVAYDLMAKWRMVHFPISLAFTVLTLGHIVSIFLFWKWS